MSSFEKNYSNVDYENYIKILEDNGIKNSRESIENMYIIDYLMLNDDRHLNNFGIIRDVNKLKWTNIAPIFDTGQSLYISSYNDDEIIINGQGKFFYNIEHFDTIIKNVRNLKRIDISKLDGVVEEFDELLHKYKHITNMSEDRITKLCILLNSRIKKLKDMIKS